MEFVDALVEESDLRLNVIVEMAHHYSALILRCVQMARCHRGTVVCCKSSSEIVVAFALATIGGKDDLIVLLLLTTDRLNAGSQKPALEHHHSRSFSI